MLLRWFNPIIARLNINQAHCGLCAVIFSEENLNENTSKLESGAGIMGIPEEREFNDLKDIFKLTNRPEEELFYSREDPNDIKMGEYVRREPDQYRRSDLVILGCPQDLGVKRNKGKPGARKAPDEIRRALYTFPVPENMICTRIFDLGNLIISESLEQIHEHLYSVVHKILTDGKRAIILGGGNDISFPDCRALADQGGETLAINIDSHYDVREDDPPNSGTPYRQLLDGGYIQPDRFYEIANKDIANSPIYKKYLEDMGAHVYTLAALREVGLDFIFDNIMQDKSFDATFWGFDLDAVRSVDAPGVSASYPVGLTAEEICKIAEFAGKDRRTRALEISEVNPDLDLNHRTSKLAAMIIMYYLRE